MDFGRTIRHLASPPWAVKRALPPHAMDEIARTVVECEGRHHGEVRFAVEAALDTGRLLRGESARERAIEVFSDLRIWDTEYNNGVLIYLLLADHDVEIVADRGIHKLVGTQGWEEICHGMEECFRRGDFLKGVQEGIRAVSSHLERHFPRRGEDRNELPDVPHIL